MDKHTGGVQNGTKIGQLKYVLETLDIETASRKGKQAELAISEMAQHTQSRPTLTHATLCPPHSRVSSLPIRQIGGQRTASSKAWTVGWSATPCDDW